MSQLFFSHQGVKSFPAYERIVRALKIESLNVRRDYVSFQKASARYINVTNNFILWKVS